MLSGPPSSMQSPASTLQFFTLIQQQKILLKRQIERVNHSLLIAFTCIDDELKLAAAHFDNLRIKQLEVQHRILAGAFETQSLADFNIYLNDIETVQLPRLWPGYEKLSSRVKKLLQCIARLDAFYARLAFLFQQMEAQFQGKINQHESVAKEINDFDARHASIYQRLLKVEQFIAEQLACEVDPVSCASLIAQQTARLQAEVRQDYGDLQQRTHRLLTIYADLDVKLFTYAQAFEAVVEKIQSGEFNADTVNRKQIQLQQQYDAIVTQVNVINDALLKKKQALLADINAAKLQLSKTSYQNITLEATEDLGRIWPDFHWAQNEVNALELSLLSLETSKNCLLHTADLALIPSMSTIPAKQQKLNELLHELHDLLLQQQPLLQDVTENCLAQHSYLKESYETCAKFVKDNANYVAYVKNPAVAALDKANSFTKAIGVNALLSKVGKFTDFVPYYEKCKNIVDFYAQQITHEPQWPNVVEVVKESLSFFPFDTSATDTYISSLASSVVTGLHHDIANLQDKTEHILNELRMRRIAALQGLNRLGSVWTQRLSEQMNQAGAQAWQVMTTDYLKDITLLDKRVQAFNIIPLQLATIRLHNKEWRLQHPKELGDAYHFASPRPATPDIVIVNSVIRPVVAQPSFWRRHLGKLVGLGMGILTGAGLGALFGFFLAPVTFGMSLPLGIVLGALAGGIVAGSAVGIGLGAVVDHCTANKKTASTGSSRGVANSSQARMLVVTPPNMRHASAAIPKVTTPWALQQRRERKLSDSLMLSGPKVVEKIRRASLGSSRGE